MPTVDVETQTVYYSDAFSLMEELQAMGEQNAGANRELGSCSNRDVLLASAAAYQAAFAASVGGHVAVPATFQVIYFVGWVADD